MARLAYLLTAGLVGAALLHIVIVLSVPRFADRDAWAGVNALGAAHRFHTLQNGATDGLASANPLARAVVCRFDIAENPVRITAFERPFFWSLAIFDTASNEIDSMNDRTAGQAVPDVVLATPSQAHIVRQTLPDAVLIAVSETVGYAVLRTVLPDASWQRIADSFLGGALCQPIASS